MVMLGKKVQGYEGVHGREWNSFEGVNGIGEQNLEGRMLLELCDQKNLCVVNT